jgi:crotonobetainyl-CoA:carnitine CoA-transferase CaiB-like acyl-CoA transferase
MGLLQARKTGQGLYVDYAVTEGAMSLLGTYMLDYQVNGRSTRRPGFPPGNRSVWPAVAPHNTYRCSGKDRVGQDWWVFIACETQAQFESLARLMGQPELCADPRFATNEARVVAKAELIPQMERILLTRTKGEWIDLLEAAGVPCAPINTLPEAVADPQAVALGMIQPVPDDEYELVGLPLSFDGMRPDIRRAPPRPGEHNAELLGPGPW